MDIVHKVITAHHSCHTGIDSSLERRKIDLIDRTLIRIRTDMVAVGLLIIECKMLYRGHHALRLHTLDILRRCLCSKERVLTHILEITATERAAIDIHARTKEDMHTTRTRILTESHTHLIYNIFVPCSGRSHSTGEKRTLCVVAHTLRAVCHTDQRNPQTLDGTYVESVLGAPDICTFLLQGHLLHQSRGTVTMLLRHGKGMVGNGLFWSTTDAGNDNCQRGRHK